MEIVLISLLYVSLFISLYWLQVIFVDEKKAKKIGTYPSVSIVIPAYNEETSIKDAIKSLLNLDYPKDRYEIIVVDDGSTDKTIDIVKEFKHVKLITQKNSGKASALNTALRNCNSELFVCLDADSRVEARALLETIGHLSDKKVAAAISAIKIDEPKSFIEKLQWHEYLMSSFLRRLMSRANMLNMTHGVFSVYRREILLKVGGFDENNLTEDYEIAMRLFKHGYTIKMDNGSVGYTKAPKNFKNLTKQRERWARGYIFNGIKYRKMFFNKEYGTLGLVHLPMTLVGILLLLITTFIVFFKFLRGAFNSVLDIAVVKTDLLKLIKLPDIRFLLNIDNLLYFPILIGLCISIYFCYKAHQSAGEKLKYPFVFFVYFLYYGFIHSFVWTKSILKEVGGAKRKW